MLWTNPLITQNRWDEDGGISPVCCVVLCCVVLCCVVLCCVVLCCVVLCGRTCSCNIDCLLLFP